MSTSEKSENEKQVEFLKEIGFWLGKFYDAIDNNADLKKGLLRNARFMQEDGNCEKPKETSNLIGELLELDYTIQQHRDAFGIFMKQNTNDDSYMN